MRRNTTTIRNMAIVVLILAFISQILLAVRTTKDAGMSFFEYAQLSDFGLFLAMWGYSPTWVLISLALFFGGGITFFFAIKR